MTDPIDSAIAKTEPEKEPDALVSELQWPDGRRARLIVPIDFTSDDFETCIGALMTLRVESEQRKAAAAASTLLVAERKIVGLDGKALS